MERYGDLITNGLDLISFLLVTPEIVKAIAPAANALLPFGILCLFGFIAALPALFATRTFDLRNVVLATIPTTFMVTAGFAGDWVVRLADRATRHFFAIGLVLFFISRLIAFYGSAVKAQLL